MFDWLVRKIHDGPYHGSAKGERPKSVVNYKHPQRAHVPPADVIPKPKATVVGSSPERPEPSGRHIPICRSLTSDLRQVSKRQSNAGRGSNGPMNTTPNVSSLPHTEGSRPALGREPSCEIRNLFRENSADCRQPLVDGVFPPDSPGAVPVHCSVPSYLPKVTQADLPYHPLKAAVFSPHGRGMRRPRTTIESDISEENNRSSFAIPSTSTIPLPPTFATPTFAAPRFGAFPTPTFSTAANVTPSAKLAALDAEGRKEKRRSTMPPFASLKRGLSLLRSPKQGSPLPEANRRESGTLLQVTAPSDEPTPPTRDIHFPTFRMKP
ncbi:uncharacterized protein BXZ73DRAFT_73077 [Epithele typhae]|uniref:uncharacterized protein n=1 Tax=Epithele typhae TaxID=378194 RepID=UPI0020076B01|nr:uncharacterized protein BXZ73DRAFT_73077 [Epithele typhae]KAH9946286.1 hypothetical protein BXZ73DRAFT_73077 [Epithele typhae]